MKVLIVHFRSAPGPTWEFSLQTDKSDSAGTGGVSLEMKKRRKLLESMGMKSLFAPPTIG